MRSVTQIVYSLTALVLGLLALASCGGASGTAGAPEQQLPPAAQVPDFPLDRAAAVVVDSTLQGNQFLEKSSGPAVTINSLSFDVAALSSEYAVYQFAAGDDELLKLTLNLAIDAGNEAYVGLADFSKGRWQWGSPVNQASTEFDLSSNSGYKSPGGNFYFAVVGWDLTQFDINSAVVQTDRALFNIGGTVTENDFNLPDVSISLSPVGTEVFSDANGSFEFELLPPGTYTLTAEKPGYSFDPVNIEVTLVDADSMGNHFSAQDLGLPSHNISGNVQFNGGGLEGVTLTTSPGGFNTQTDVNGDYTIAAIPDGNYTVTPSLAGYEFDPVDIAVNLSGADISGNNFTASEIVIPTYKISGSVGVGTSHLQDVLITVQPGAIGVVTDSNGYYEVTGLEAGSYTVTPSKLGFVFDPSSRNVDIIDMDVPDVDFTATPDNNGNFTVSGHVNGPPGGLSGATITLTPQSGPPIQGVSVSGGGYSIANVPSGIYSATCTKSGWTITPFSQEVIVVDQDVTGVNWFASPPL